MEQPLFLSMYYNGVGKLIMINRTTTRSHIFQQAAGEWTSLRNDSVAFNYSVGPILNCSLKTDQDVLNMVLCCDELKLALATLNIVDITNDLTPSKSIVSQLSPTPLGSMISKRKFQEMGVNQVDEFEGHGALPSYDVSPENEKTPSLNDGWSTIITGNGQLFRGGAVEFREKVVKFTTKLGFTFNFHRNDSRYVHVVCTEKVEHDCGWFINAGRQPHNKFFAINSCNLVHRCVGKLVTKKKSRLGAAILGKLFTDNIRQDPTVKGKDVRGVVKLSYGFDISMSRAHRTVGYSKGQIFGNYKDSYNNLPWYAAAVEKTNPGSIVKLEREKDSNHFKRLFIAFYGSLEAFKECRPMLFTDGTFASGRASGTILAATAKDGNNGLVPVAFAVVSQENLDNWKWFLELLRDHVKHPLDILYISDRHTGLMSAFPQVFEHPLNFFCLQHLKTNLQKLFGGRGCGVRRDRMWELFKDVAYAPTLFLFDQKMKIFREEGGEDASNWVDTLPVKQWALAHSSEMLRYGEMTSNAIESFNGWILGARSLPVTYMVDSIRLGIMRWFVERRAAGAKWTGALCQNKEEHWNALTDMGSTWNITECPNGDYEVGSGPSVQVNLKARTCSCYRWQTRGFPCAHAVAVIRKVCNNINEVVDSHFLTKTYQRCYSANINPIPQTEKFECLPLLVNEPPMLPPISDSTLGRPTEKRRRSVFEIHRKKKPVVCPKCGLLTRHDVFTCGAEPEEARNT